MRPAPLFISAALAVGCASASDAASAIKDALQSYSGFLPPNALSAAPPALLAGVAGVTETLGALQALGSKLPQTGNGGLADLEGCLKAVVEAGKLPTGASCVGANGQSASGLQSTFNGILEQFVGVIPPNVVDQLQSAAAQAFVPLIPSGKEMLSSISSAMSSVTAALSGNAVSAVEAVESCFAHASSSPSPITCLTAPAPGSPLSYASTALLGASNQFAGYLPPNILSQARNVFLYYCGLPGSTPGGALQRQVGDALESVGASLSGSSATLFAQLVECAKAASADAGVDRAFTCAKAPGGPLSTAQTRVNGVAEQFIGYLPPNVALDLAAAAAPYTHSLAPGAGAVASALRKTFDASGAGPAFVTCYETLSGCIVSAIQTGAQCAGPTANDKCKPVAPALRRKRSVKLLR